MVTKISKWGNSQGIRLSSEILSETGYSAGDEVSVTATKNGILIQKSEKRPKKLKAYGALKKYAKRFISDEEMSLAWADVAERSWNEKDS